MDILIKNMKRPKICTGCFHSKCLLFFENTDPNNTRHPNCPIVAVGKHGRLVDADIVKNLIVNAFVCFGKVTLDNILELIDGTPTELEATE